MTRAVVCGLGLVGRRIARQLTDTGAFSKVVVCDRSLKRAESTAALLGSHGEVMAWPVSPAALRNAAVVVTALPEDLDVEIVAHALGAGVPVVSVADGSATIQGLLAFDERARAVGIPVVIGCGFAPGIADVLAAHGAGLFAHVDEVRVARAGASGSASIAAVRRERREVPSVWRGGTWVETKRLVEQVWFPEPIGAVDCQAVRGGGELLARHFGPTTAVTTTWAETRQARWPQRGDDGLGALRVEVWGRTERNECDVVVYGVLDRVSIAVGTLAGIVGERVGSGEITTPGVHGVAELVDPVSVLRDLDQRGVHAAAFEGAPIS